MNAEQRAEARARIAAATGGAWGIAETEVYGRLVWGVGVDYDPSDPTGQTAVQTQEIVAQRIPRTDDAEFIAHAIDDLPAALDAIDRVLALHPQTTIQDAPDNAFPACASCFTEWPCATVRAIEGAS